LIASLHKYDYGTAARYYIREVRRLKIT
jgi:hypothetical protein